MKTTTRIPDSCAPSRFLGSLFAVALQLVLLLALSAASSFAGSATWKTSPSSGDWNTARNWNPNTVPNGSADTATFKLSNTTNVSISLNTEVNGIVFNPGASAFTITAGPTLTLTVSGAGVANNSGIAQNFVTTADITGKRGTIQFRNSATVGNLTGFTNNGPPSSDQEGGITQFFDSSSAGNGGFSNTIGPGGGAGGGGVEFHDNSTAGSGGFFNYTGFTFIRFFGSSTAGSGTFYNGGRVSFSDASTAGSGTFTNNNGSLNDHDSGKVFFSDASNAASGTFTNYGAETGDGSPGFTAFLGSSSAGNGTFTCQAGQGEGSSAQGGAVSFDEASTAENATFTMEGGADAGDGGGSIFFVRQSTAAQATLIANGGVSGGEGGSIFFRDDSTGGTSRIEVFGNGNLDISGHNAPGVSVGSIQGSGLVFLGAFNLTVGNNNRSKNFSGLIQDGGRSGGSGGSLNKVGRGSLVLRNSNAYTGGTTINGGKLVVNNESGSGTGSGPVRVNAGRLGGRGIIAGDVTLGDGSGRGAILSPGKSADTRGTLIIASTLTFNSDATDKFELNSNTRNADSVIANGVTINSGAQCSFADLGSATLRAGKVFTVINNTSANPIAGAFSNLSDGSTFSSNGNKYKANYEGGDGNDLTLTVVR